MASSSMVEEVEGVFVLKVLSRYLGLLAGKRRLRTFIEAECRSEREKDLLSGLRFVERYVGTLIEKDFENVERCFLQQAHCPNARALWHCIQQFLRRESESDRRSEEIQSGHLELEDFAVRIREGEQTALRELLGILRASHLLRNYSSVAKSPYCGGKAGALQIVDALHRYPEFLSERRSSLVRIGLISIRRSMLQLIRPWAIAVMRLERDGSGCEFVESCCSLVQLDEKLRCPMKDA